MDGTTPSRESFELGAKLCHMDLRDAQGMAEIVGETHRLLETMTSVEVYRHLVNHLHLALRHQPLFEINCEAHTSALASIMSQMFACGYAAGRQEVIDMEIAKMEART